MSAPTTSVLFDAPGPRARRLAVIASAVSGLFVVGLAYLVYRKLETQGQFTSAKWGPLLDPSDKNFHKVWKRLGGGLQNTLKAAGFSIVLSLVIGTVIAVARLRLADLARRRWVGLPRPLALALRGLAWLLAGLTRGFVEFFRGLPVLLAIFFAWRILPSYGVHLANLWYLVIGLTLYNSVVIAEIVRAGVVSLPRGQVEAARAVGLTEGQSMRVVLLPQAFRIMLPALISQLVVILKDTSLGFVISFEETLRVGGQVIQVLHNPLQVYAVLAAVFIAINYTLSRLATYLERRMSQGRRGPAATPTDPSAPTSPASELATAPGLAG